MSKVIFKISFLLIGVLLPTSAAYIYQQLYLPLNFSDEGYVFELPKGKTLSHFTTRLANDGYIRHAKLANAYARLLGLDKQVKAGEYHFDGQVSFKGALNKIVEGKTIERSITFVEGWSLRELTIALKEEEHLVSLEEDLDMGRLSRMLKDEHVSLEGLFFADTYFFSKGSNASEILEYSYRRLEQVLQKEWAEKEDGLPYKNAYEALIMASIVEKETGLSSERPLIAAVFVNRLNIGMRLQTDPTVIYGLGDEYAGNIRRRHLKAYTPYNTYRINGLPPTPIAIVGRESIHAVLHPSKTKNLYFVAKGDGSHYFSPTLKEHQGAVRKYQWRRSKNYRSSPEAN